MTSVLLNREISSGLSRTISPTANVAWVANFLSGPFPAPFSFTRASGAMVWNSAGVMGLAGTNTPRLDTRPVTLASRGLLVEAASANMVLNNNDFNLTSWAFEGSSVRPNLLTAPDGTLTADVLVEGTGTSPHQIRQEMYKSGISAPYAISVFAKPQGRNRLHVSFGDHNTYSRVAIVADLTGAGSVLDGPTANGSFTLNGTPASVTAVGNGWYRIAFSGTCDTGVELRIRIGLDNGSGLAYAPAPNYTGDGVSGCALWGAQLEAGTTVTSMMSTGAATTARALDYPRVNDVSLLGWNQGEYTLFTEYEVAAWGAGRTVLALGNSAVGPNEAVIIGGAGASLLRLSGTRQDGGAPFTLDTAYGTTAGVHKLALRVKNNDIAAFVDGILVGTATNAAVPSVKELYAGNNAGNAQLGGWMRKIAVYPYGLSNAEMQNL